MFLVEVEKYRILTEEYLLIFFKIFFFKDLSFYWHFSSLIHRHLKINVYSPGPKTLL